MTSRFLSLAVSLAVLALSAEKAIAQTNTNVTTTSTTTSQVSAGYGDVQQESRWNQELVRPGSWSFDVGGGSGFDVGDDFNKGTTSVTPFTLSTGGVAGSTTVNKTAWQGAFDNIYDGRFGVSYGITHTGEAFVNGVFQYGSGNNRTLGYSTVTTAGLASTVPLTGKLSDYNDYGLEFGWRQFLPFGAYGLTPYVAPWVGVRYVDHINLDNFSVGGTTVSNLRLYDQSVLISGGLAIGVRDYITPYLSLNIESGVRVNQGLRREGDGVHALGLDNVNQSDNRIVIPALLRIKATF